MAQQTPFLPLYRALVENAQDVLGVIDLAGQIRYLNPAARLWGRGRAEQLIDQPLQSLCHPQDQRILASWLQGFQRVHERQVCELRLGPDQRWRRVQLSGVRIREDESSEVIVISGHDVTLEVDASRALKASEKRYHGAFDYSPIGKALLAADGQVVEANRSLAEMLGCWVSELLGSNLFARVGGDAHDQLLQDVTALIGRHDDVRERELSFQRVDGQVLWLLINLAPIWRDDGELEHFIAQVQDITARRQAEQNLRESNADLLRSNEELKRFAFLASHDLREPLRGIGGSVQLIARRYKDALGESGHELAQQAVSGVKRMQALLDDLVAYAEQMRGGELERRTVSVSAVIDEVRQQLDASIRAQDADITTTDLPSILADPEQIRQIFVQLIDNALKFARPQVPPQVHISARWQRGLWEFCVADNGIGIAPEHHQQIFEVFRRLDPDTAGTGMGLATVRKIIERHGGTIRVESSAGDGARFRFTLPPE